MSDATTQEPSVGLTMELVRALLCQRTRVGWLQWLPLAIIAAEAPQVLARTMDQLDLEEQYGLLALLGERGAGPLAQLVTLSLAESVDAIREPMIRDYLLEDGIAALNALLAAADGLRANAEALARQVGVRQSLLAGSFDAASESARFRGELLILQRQVEHGPETVRQACALQRQVHLLEVQRAVLAHDDVDALSRRRAEFQRELDERTGRRRELDEELRSLGESLDQLRRQQQQVEQLRGEEDRLREDLRRSQAGHDAEVARAKEETERSRAREAEQQAELARLRQERATLGEQADRSLALLASERQALAELRAAAEAGGHEEILRRMRELYVALPGDQADAVFRRGR